MQLKPKKKKLIIFNIKSASTFPPYSHDNTPTRSLSPRLFVNSNRTEQSNDVVGVDLQRSRRAPNQIRRLHSQTPQTMVRYPPPNPLHSPRTTSPLRLPRNRYRHSLFLNHQPLPTSPPSIRRRCRKILLLFLKSNIRPPQPPRRVRAPNLELRRKDSAWIET